jgi:hypothetical protein
MDLERKQRGMKKARLLSPSGVRVVDADILKQSVIDKNDPLTQQDVINGSYVCLHCDARVHPAAIGLTKPGTNEEYCVSPYFSLYDGELHNEDECDYLKRINSSGVDPSDEALERKTTERYPNRLSLDWLDPLKQEFLGRGNGIHKQNNNLSNSRNSTLHSNWTAESIAPLVNHFLPFENRQSRLFVPGIEGTTYSRVFENLCFAEKFDQKALRIYFSQIIYKKTSRTINNIFRFYLTDGTYDNNSHTPIVKAELVVDTNKWMPRDIQELKFKISSITASADELRHQGNLKKGKALPWIFFLGYAKSENDSSPKLLADDFRLIELRVTEKLNNVPMNVPSHSSQAEPSGSIDDENELEQDELSLNETDRTVQPEPLSDETQGTQVQEINEPSSGSQNLTEIEDPEPFESEQQRTDLNVDTLEPSHSTLDDAETHISLIDNINPEPQPLIEEAPRLAPRQTEFQEHPSRILSDEDQSRIQATKVRAKRRRDLRRKAFESVTKAAQKGINTLKVLAKSLIRFLRGL